MTFSITSPGPFACQYVKHSEKHKDHITYRSVLFLFTLNYYPINPSLNTQKQEKKYLLFTMIWLLIYSQNLPSILEIFRQIFLAFQHFPLKMSQRMAYVFLFYAVSVWNIIF